MKPDQIERLKELVKEELVKVANRDIPSTKEIVALFSLLLSKVNQSIKDTKENLQITYKNKVSEIVDNNNSKLEEIKKSLEEEAKILIESLSNENTISTKEWYKTLNNAIYGIEQQIKNIEKYDSSLLESKWSLVIDDLNTRIENIKPSILSPTEIRDSLETLEGDERFDISSIKGWDKVIEDIKKSGKSVRLVGGTNGIMVYNGSTKLGIVKYINFTGGGVSSSLVNGLLTLTFSSGSFSGTQEKSTTIPNGVLTTFAFTHTPGIIIWNGSIQTLTDDYTVSSLTITFTGSAGVPLTNDKIVNIYA